jgi:site-specific DNA-methyltransferase (adenine-specific)
MLFVDESELDGEVPIEPNIVVRGECLNVMSHIKEDSIQLVLTDPPYGTTNCSWDSIIPLPEMWEALQRVIQKKRAIVLFCSQPFTSVLITSNMEWYKYSWVWEKNMATGFLDSRWRPLNSVEDIAVFSSKGWTFYNPQMEIGKMHTKTLGTNTELYKSATQKGVRPSNLFYPKRVLRYDSIPRSDPEKFHPTQKPVPLLEYLILTYTNPGETVLDFTAGSMSTAIAALNTRRRFIGIEMSQKYFDLGAARIERRMAQLSALGFSEYKRDGISPDSQVSLFQWAGIQEEYYGHETRVIKGQPSTHN